MIRTIVSAATMLLLASPALAGPLQMDVADVRLGMRLEQAEAALAPSYRCDTNGMHEETFDELVAVEVGKRQQRFTAFGPKSATSELTCAGKHGEYLRVYFAQTPGGSVVDELDLTVPYDGLDKVEVRKQLAAKYGKPTVGTLAYGSWCDAGYRCGSGVALSDGPLFAIQDFGSSAKIMSTRGARARKADEAGVIAAADKRAPKAGRAAF